MFDIYIKDFNQDDRIITEETLVQSIPSTVEGDLKLLSPIVKCEMGNAESFTFNIEGGTKFYDAFKQMKTFMRVVYDNNTIFYGRVLTIENSFYGTRKIRCEGPLAFLNDTSLEGKKEESRSEVSVLSYLSSLINNHNTMCDEAKRSFRLGEVPGLYSASILEDQKLPNATRKFGSEGWTDTKAAIDDLRSHYGGYLRARSPGHKSVDGKTFIPDDTDGAYSVLDWMNHYFNKDENDQTIEVGKNVIDITTSTEIDNIFTVVIPIGNSKSTSTETADGTKRSTGPKHFYVDGYEVKVPDICSGRGGPYNRAALNSGYHTYEDYDSALDKYGRIIKTVTFDDAETKSDLLVKCREWIKNNYQGEVTKFTVKAVDMHQVGNKSVSKIMVGDRVKIIYPVIKEDGSIKNVTENGKVGIVRTCLSISYDLYNPENNAYTFGIPANILTKSYGATKQGKSTTDPSTTPKSSGYSSSSKTEDWLDKITAWLSNHKICYRHQANVTVRNPITLKLDNNHLDTNANSHMPWTPSTQALEKGPYTGMFSEHGNYFYDTSTYVGAGKYNLWKCVPDHEGSTFDQDELNKLIREGTAAMIAAHAPQSSIDQVTASIRKRYESEHPSLTNWTCTKVTLDGVLSYAALQMCNIVNYVKQEYGIDLKNNFAGVSPANSLTYKDEFGVDVTVAEENGNTVTKEMYSPNYEATQEDNERGYHLTTSYEGKTVVSQMDNEGNWVYTVWDPVSGTSVETHIRDLDLHQVQAADFLGTAITEGKSPALIDPNGELHTYYFGQGIEKWADGEVTTAVVDGDVIRLGTSATKYSTSVAQRINGQWIHPVEYYVDTSGAGRNKAKHGSITIGDAGTAQYDAYLSKKCKPPQYLPVPSDFWNKTDQEKLKWKQDNIYNYPNNDITSFVGAGTWDTENLAITGGIYTVVEDDKPITYIASKRLIMGDRNTAKTVQKALLESGAFSKRVLNPSTGKYEWVTVTDAADFDDAELDDAIITPKLVAQSIFAEEISGVNAHFHTIETDYLKSEDFETKFASVKYLSTKQDGTLTISGALVFSDTGSFRNNASRTVFQTRSGASEYVTATPLDFYMDLQVVDAGSNKYKMQYKKLGNSNWIDLPNTTFSRATTLSPVWGSGDKFPLTIHASPQGNSYTIGFNGTLSSDTNLRVAIDGNATVDTSIATGKYLDQNYKIIQETGTSSQPTRFISSDHDMFLVINGTPVYNNGWNTFRTRVLNNLPYNTDIGTGSNDSISFLIPDENGSSNNATYTYGMSLTSYTPPGSSAYKCIELKSGSNKVVARLSINSDWNNRYNSGWNDCRTRAINNIPSSDIGYGTNNVLTIKVPNSNGSTAFSDYKFTMSLGEFKPGTSAVKCINLKNNSNNVVARLDINTEWNNQYTAGMNGIINAGGALTQDGNCTNKTINKYVTTLTVTGSGCNHKRIYVDNGTQKWYYEKIWVSSTFGYSHSFTIMSFNGTVTNLPVSPEGYVQLYVDG